MFYSSDVIIFKTERAIHGAGENLYKYKYIKYINFFKTLFLKCTKNVNRNIMKEDMQIIDRSKYQRKKNIVTTGTVRK